MKFETWFPTVIGISRCPFINEIQSPYKKIIENYPVDRYGFINVPIHRKPQFKKLTDWITQEVNTFSENHRFAFKYEPKESWVWNYEVGVSQEFHTHLGYTISTVFFLEGYQEDSPLVFRNPMHNDMKNPLGTQPHTSMDARSGTLLVWRSYVEHKVGKDKIHNNKKRIVFVYNFDPNSS